MGHFLSIFNMPRTKKGQKTITEKMLGELRKGTPLKEIREKHGSQSRLYAAFQIFFQEVDAKVSEKQSLIAEMKALEDEVESLKQKTIQLTDDGRTLDNSIQEKTGQLRIIERDIEDRKKARAQLKVLDDKGISIQLIQSISNMDVNNREDLLARMKTVEAYNREEQNYRNLVTNRKKLEKEIKSYTAKKTRLESKIGGLKDNANSERQRLDEARLATRTYKEAVAVTQSYLQDGYSIPMLKSLREALNAS